MAPETVSFTYSSFISLNKIIVPNAYAFFLLQGQKLHNLFKIAQANNAENDIIIIWIKVLRKANGVMKKIESLLFFKRHSATNGLR